MEHMASFVSDVQAMPTNSLQDEVLPRANDLESCALFLVEYTNYLDHLACSWTTYEMSDVATEIEKVKGHKRDTFDVHAT